MNAKICFIGAGNMAKSLIGGLIASGYDANNILATDPNQEQRDALSSQFAIQTYANNGEALMHADIIVLAVKPQILRQVCAEISDTVQAGSPLIISVAAGIRTDDINRWLGGELAIVRTMPNTPALIQTGAIGLYANSQVNSEQKSQAEHIMRATGLTLWVEQENQIDVVTALSGSGPAYYFLFMEAMEKAAQDMGLDAKSAHLLTMQTALGAAKMVMESHQDCAELRANVTSPNGTTEKAIQYFETHNLRDTVAGAMNAARNRAQELADELGGEA
ncbi:pyrroline-5-carboxylate reductase [Thiomicrorhabdus sp. 6S2-11]|jgi:pyrroline-5-carboxylate reductase|uniref:Pyrroline-5-carboxylate reductase n=1 Tax=Thiomicrorhabdus marina TaxID=2818442 RepID=A0ABS3Q425_9GAMM|nr:pyrroline-5-carboxylate reductase [Thiomicrorhabdus marina]MBO1926913.1 pyrroline-5-carboxylate reductase [Thiomicrorhabdus marina]